jgi:hypothetical protein
MRHPARRIGQYPSWNAPPNRQLDNQWPQFEAENRELNEQCSGRRERVTDSGYSAPTPLPGFNSGVALAQITGGISTRWNAATGTVTRYELYRSTSSGVLGSRIYSGTGLTFNDTGLTSGTYYYTAQACNDSGCVSGRQDFFTYS